MQRVLLFTKLVKKIQKFWLKVKWNSSFLENPFGYCRLTSRDSILFLFGTEQWKFLYHLVNSPVSSPSSAKNNYQISSYKWLEHNLVWLVCWFWENPNHYPAVIPTGSFWQLVSTPWYVSIMALNSLDKLTNCEKNSKHLVELSSRKIFQFR